MWIGELLRGISARKRVNLLWLVLNFTLRGLSSYSVRPLWPLVFLSWNSRTRRWTVDLPWVFKWTSKPRPPLRGRW